MPEGEPREITPEEEWQITCHEAGHAVMAVRLEMSFVRAARGPGEFGEVEVGITPLDDPNRACSQEEIVKWRLFYAGGAAAEVVCFGKYRTYAASRDRALHERLEKLAAGGRVDGWNQDIESAVKLLDREAIAKVATNLARHGQLSEEQIYDLFDRKPPWWNNA
jgi:hypothetical protein